MKLESPSFFISGTGVRQTYPCMEYRLGTNGRIVAKFLRYLDKSAKNGLWKSLHSQSLFEKVNFHNFSELHMLMQIRIQFSILDKNIHCNPFRLS
jgi:hypothetical protein